ncbi:hypothetical protein C8Q76DRAFT_601935, partial [Earliella scabrosa]
PEWFADALKHLEEVSEEPWWKGLVAAWVNVERALEFPDGQVASNRLSPKHRPEEVKFWIARGRKYDNPPKIKSLPAFIASWRKWWSRLQPAERRSDESVWPLLRNPPADAASWSDVRRGGCNGLFMVLMTLSWWLRALDEGGDTAELRSAVEDVTWVCTTIAPVLQDTPVAANPD